MDTWTSWQAEQAGTNRLPSIFSVLLVLGLLAALALALVAGPTTATAASGPRRQQSLCEEHRGDPGWASVCREARRR
jgi:hypothetical protein